MEILCHGHRRNTLEEKNVDRQSVYNIIASNKIHSKHLSKCHCIFSFDFHQFHKNDHNFAIFLFIEKLSV
jgi:hypothetical protein